MKKILYAVILLLGLSMVIMSSCTKDPSNGGGNNDNTYNGPEYVDLGLPSGTLWATCNVGASSPEDYGDYFAWGETTTKSSYDWSNYKYCNGSGNRLTKYCTSDSFYYGVWDGLTILQADDDAATANRGSDWRMPTIQEGWELIDYTTVIVTTQNGVIGCCFTGSNGNSIFLPGAGYCEGEGGPRKVGRCYYWMSSLVRYDACNAYYLTTSGETGHYQRRYGLSVRPVRSASKN